MKNKYYSFIYEGIKIKPIKASSIEEALIILKKIGLKPDKADLINIKKY